MDIVYLKKLVKIIELSTVDEIEIEEEGLKVRVAKNAHQNMVPVHVAPMHQVATSHAAPVPPKPEASTPAATEVKQEAKFHEVKSPIVGTFYRAPAPDADAYVEVGAVVQPKQVLCIIEAMKLMNEIECDVSGRIVKILVENAKPVEYNQTLFLIEPV